MQAQFISAAPHFAEKNIVVEFRKFGGELTELGASCCLYYFSCAITLSVKMLNTEIKKILFIVVLLYEIIEFISWIERRLVRQY